jgi:hypothetical protein
MPSSYAWTQFELLFGSRDLSGITGEYDDPRDVLRSKDEARLLALSMVAHLVQVS